VDGDFIVAIAIVIADLAKPGATLLVPVRGFL
jgi:hypothetical protein